MTRRVELYGTAVPDLEPLRIAAGRLSFDLIGGNVRAVRCDGVEVLRAIQYLVRDRDWGTLAPAIEDLNVEERADGATVTYRATVRDGDGATLTYEARIAATGAGLDFTVRALAGADFTTCRLGFCVLHPAHLAGTPLAVEHVDASVDHAVFPDLIAPWQPFTDIAGLVHRQGDVVIGCRFEGDVFEMEDQRNWSDASYKTYVRPLARPWPYVVPRGTVDHQAVRLSVEGGAPVRAPHADAPLADAPITVAPGAAIGVMPRIGLVVTAAEAAATLAAIEALDALAPQDLLLSFRADAGEAAAEMAALARVAARARARITLECVVAGGDDPGAELAEVARHVADAGLGLDGLAVFPAPDLQSTPPGSAWPPCPPFADIYAAARRAFPGVPLGGGMFSYFTELNRKRPPVDLLDFVTHATCPIVHAADDLSVMQTLETIPYIVRSARAIIGEASYRLGPMTIGMRQNPYGSRTMDNPDGGRVPMARVDPRQAGRFAAAWTLGHVAASAEGRLDTVTLGALTGPFGVLGPDGPRPVFDTVRALAARAGAPRRACRSSRPDQILALATDDSLLLANITPDPRTVRVDGIARPIDLDAYQTAHVAL